MVACVWLFVRKVLKIWMENTINTFFTLHTPYTRLALSRLACFVLSCPRHIVVYPPFFPASPHDPAQAVLAGFLTA
jgi:hypothetical protein